MFLSDLLLYFCELEAKLNPTQVYLSHAESRLERIKPGTGYMTGLIQAQGAYLGNTRVVSSLSPAWIILEILYNHTGTL